MLASRRFGVLLLASALPLAGHGCGSSDSGNLAANGGRGGAAAGAGTGGGGPFAGQGVGKSCSASKGCRAGLTCAAGVCAPAASTGKGGACLISGECATGTCYEGACAPNGDGQSGVSCKTDLECAAGLRCQLAGLVSVCQSSGVGDLGAACQANADCFGGLYCVNAACSPPSPTAPMGGNPFAGVRCQAAPASEPTRAYFEVPGAASADEADFFRLPFPNDVLIDANGRLDLGAFPTPGVGALGFDPVVRYVVAAQEADRGWGTDPVVIFRFSRALDGATLAQEQRVHFVDITAGTPEYGQAALGGFHYATARTPYVCDDWLAVRRPLGNPMTPGHVYAVYVTSGVTDLSGKPVSASPNLSDVLSAGEPPDPALRAAHARYAPLRDYLSEQGIPESEVLAATVISTAAVREPMAALAEAVDAADLPTARDWVRCDTGVASPCPDRASGPQRDCGPAADDYEEYHALLELPIFQRGSAPYLTEGGEIDASGPVRTQAVCLSLTVPRTAMPATGFPLVVFAHGTGGGFRDHARAEIAGSLAAAPLPNGETVGFAVLGIDQVSHGPRRGGSQQAPESLFFNIGNPAAARGNALQGAVDQLAVARFAANLDVTVEALPIKADPDALFFFGHSQGASEGSLMLPYSSLYKAAVLSGNGGSLRESLLAKKSPVDVRAALPFILSDASVKDDDVARHHPVLTLIQQWLDPADPVNFARALALEPALQGARRHVFQTYGIGDSYSPPSTLQAFVLAGGFSLVDTEGLALDPIPGLRASSPPLAGNVDGVTLGVRQYQPPPGTDGHFVAFSVPSANADVARFLAMAASGDLPAIGE